jgi:hypothetical protein
MQGHDMGDLDFTMMESSCPVLVETAQFDFTLMQRAWEGEDSKALASMSMAAAALGIGLPSLGMGSPAVVVWTSLGPLPWWVPGPTTRWAPGTTRLALHGT